MASEKPLLLVLQEQISASKGAAVERFLRLLDEAHYAADVNHRELVAGVHKVIDPEVAIDLSLLKNREKLNLVQLEIARLLQNYLDSADSLLDRINDLVKSAMPELESTWDKRLREAEHDPAIAFVKELRAYVHHSRQPVMTSTFNLKRRGDDGFDFSAMLSISRERLEQARNWGKQARRYLDSQAQDEIMLDRFAADSFSAIKEVVQWTVMRIRETYQDALAELKALHEKYTFEYEREFGSVDASN